MKPMKIQYQQTRGKIDEPTILLNNKTGGYFMHSPCRKQTRFEGLYYPVLKPEGWELVKTLHSIDIKSQPKEIQWTGRTPQIVYECGAKASYFVTPKGVLIYEIKDYQGPLRLSFDFREMYDFEDGDLEFELIRYADNRFQTLKYVKQGDSGSQVYYMTIYADCPMKPFGQSRKEHYPLDYQRRSEPWEREVVDMFLTPVDQKSIRICFGFSEERQTAEILTRNAAAQYQELESLPKRGNVIELNTEDKDILQAVDFVSHSLSTSLIWLPEQHGKGIYAGYPWFYQWWTRDEAISLGGLMVSGHAQQVKDILMRQVLKPLDDGRFPNRYPAADLGSADGIGWNATRFLAMLENELSQFEEDELDNLYNLFTEQLEKLEQHYLKDGLIINKSHETWMDTGGEQDPRNGACIEIQLLHHNINRLQSKLAKITGKEDKSKNRLPDIKDAFFDKGRLADRISESGEKDFTARPNLFIAAYLCPDLLSKNEWKDVFQWAFDELWLPWGGLSTISKSSTLFQPFYTGQTDESYHRGDSWYWINNISAIALNRICPEDYKEEIEKILKASTREILFSGAPGHHAELSSAFDLRSEGCFAQSWSAATYLELARELF